MRKLNLDIDALQVEAFEVTAPRGERGTVLGAEFTGPANCVTISCGNSEQQPCEL